MKCAKCGVEADFKGLCIKCYLNRNPIVKEIKKATMYVCECGKIKVNNWVKETIDERIPLLLDKIIILNKYLENPKINFNYAIPESITKRTKMKVNCEISGTIEGIEISENVEFIIGLTKSVCDICQKKKSKYFQGDLQIRGENIQEVDEYIMNKLNNLEKKGVFLAKKTHLKKGIDYRLSSNKSVIKISREVHKEFGGTLKIGEQLFSRDPLRSKDIFRVNAVVKLPNFKKHKVIVFDEKIYLTKNFIGNKVKLINLKTMNEEVKEIPDKFEKKEIIEVMVLNKKPIEVMNPKTYQSQEVENETKVKENAKVVMYKDKIYLIPN